LAERKYEDDVPDEVKSRRLQEVIKLQSGHAGERTSAQVGRIYRVLAEGVSRKSENELFGRNTYNAVVVFERGDIQRGDYVFVRVTNCTRVTLLGEVVSESVAVQEGFVV
jgi:tRNA-2-methylthio-N6-dimethylallyladenosine synthase